MAHASRPRRAGEEKRARRSRNSRPERPESPPAATRPLMREIVEERISECRRLYQEQGDPFQAWIVFAAARAGKKWGIEVPEWVMAYLDRVARQFVEMSKAEPTGDALAGRAPAALEVLDGGRA